MNPQDMIEIEEIYNKELFTTQMTGFLFHKFDRIDIDIYGKIKGKEWNNLREYNTSSFFRKFILKHHTLNLNSAVFKSNRENLNTYLKDWGFYIDKDKQGLFTKHTRFIEINDKNELEEMESLLASMKEKGIIGKYECIDK